MAECPQCGDPIGYWQLNKHSVFTPITCGACGSKLHFDKRSWFRIVLPVCITLSGGAACLVLSVISGALYRAPFLLAVLLLLLLGVTTVALFVKFVVDLRHITLRVKTKKTVKQADAGDKVPAPDP